MSLKENLKYKTQYLSIMFEKLDKQLGKLPSGFIVGVITKSKNYQDINMHLLDYLITHKGSSGSYVTINRPYLNVLDILKSRNIDASKLHFIDCITKKLGGKIPNVKNCKFVSSPSHLTELSIALHNYFTGSTEKDRFLHLDSLSTLCIHNNSKDVIKFIHYVTGKMRVFGLKGVIISLREETDSQLISELSVFCDKMIRV